MLRRWQQRQDGLFHLPQAAFIRKQIAAGTESVTAEDLTLLYSIVICFMCILSCDISAIVTDSIKATYLHTVFYCIKHLKDTG